MGFHSDPYDVVGGEVADKAWRLVDQRRVVPLAGGSFGVQGDTGSYRVDATAAGVVCSCPNPGLCSHIAAAMIVWGGV